MDNSHQKLVGLIKAALVAAIYVVLTVALIMFSYGPVQFRLSEMLNNLAVFNKRYIWALTLGCVIANLWSSLGAVDVIFGSLGTLVMTAISYFLSKFVDKKWQKLAIAVIICTISVWSVALELHLVSQAPFWVTYLSVALGELGSMILGAILIGIISTKIDLTK
ncbi:QueT transporter family protein [Liquorilactobacillus sicerae]|uniref:QueT transporter family protein n=1 Tax=Liquorilactobacillus sicerae TaxID=1416943 RepID=UPI0024812C79|nr:QueT transporter family protein [Liquorilactobacillus sicerae]